MGVLMERKVSEITSRRCKASTCSTSSAKQTIQAAFIWGSAATLLSPLSTKVGIAMAADGKALLAVVSREPVVKKHLVHDQRQVVLAAERLDRNPVRMAREVTCGIVRVDDDHSLAAGGEAAAECLQVQMPAVIVDKRIGDQPHIIELGQEIEERVAGLADQHLVAGIAEQAEEETVGLAGAGGEKNVFRIDCGSMVTVIEAYGLARRAQAPWIRLVVQGRRIIEGGQN